MSKKQITDIMSVKEQQQLKASNNSKYIDLLSRFDELMEVRDDVKPAKEEFEIITIKNNLRQLLDNHFVNEYISLFNKFVKYYDLDINLEKNDVAKMLEIANYFPDYAKNKLQSIVSTNKDIFDELKTVSNDTEDDGIGYTVRISDTLYDWLTMSLSKNYSSCTNWSRIGAGANTPFLYYLSPYCKVVKFYSSREDAKLNENPIGRVVISKMPSGNVFFHRVYAKDKAQITQACHVLAPYLGGELTEASIAIKCKRGKSSYPDLMLALNSCLNKHVIVNPERVESDKKLLVKAYNKGNFTVY